MKTTLVWSLVILGVFLGIPAAHAQLIRGGNGLPRPVVNGDCIIGSAGVALWGSCSGSSSVVTGPVSSTNGYLPQWNGTAGNALSTGLPISTFLQTANNLSDLGSAATARTNLGLGTLATLSTLPLADLAGIAQNTVLGSVASGTSPPAALSTAQLTTLCNVFTASLSGCVAASGGGTANFLRADGTWAGPNPFTVATAMHARFGGLEGAFEGALGQ